jgi:DNA-binding NtrC family response regulator
MSQLHQPPNLQSPNVAVAPEAVPHFPPPAFWLDGSSPAVTQLRGQIRRVAPYFRTALLIGEPGCGEEAAARMVHQLSPLSQRPFLDLASAEAITLFADNHAEEALASIGMFYLSCPGQVSPRIQTTLLRLLRKYGPQSPRSVAFVERSLRPLVSAGGFSAELADQLGALRIVIPPLRDRREDIPQLLAHILQSIAAQSGARLPELAPDLLDAAKRLPWRGNLAQLYAAAEGLMDRATHLILHAPDLDAVLGAISSPTPPHFREVRMIRLDDVIQEHIRAVLFACNGNKLRTSEVLGISRSTLYRMLDLPSPPCSPPHTSSSLQMTC